MGWCWWEWALDLSIEEVWAQQVPLCWGLLGSNSCVCHSDWLQQEAGVFGQKRAVGLQVLEAWRLLPQSVPIWTGGKSIMLPQHRLL